MIMTNLMKCASRASILAFVALSFSIQSTAQLVVDNTITPEDALDIIIGGGINFYNVTFSGDANQIGSFNSANSNLLIEEGLVLATGDCAVAIGPNNIGSQTTGGGNFGVGDVDLTTLSTFETNDAAVLEFDFIAEGDSVTFNYSFGSEEYNEYVCGSVNDAFGFFLSGPGITGPFENDAVNLAIIPNTDIPVTINTVNLGVVGSAGTETNCEQVSPDWALNTQFYVDNENNADPNSTQLDGFTVVLQAAAEVECGGEYHIKIAIADAGDTAFDSCVFLEADSFVSNAVEIDSDATVETDITLPDATILEDCVEGQFTFTINVDELEPDQDTIFFEISGTAENGVDYAFIDDFFVIDEDFAGHFDLDITPFEDGLDEEEESIILSYIFTNDCGEMDTTIAELTVVDHPGVSVQLADVELCPDIESVDLTYMSIEGIGPFTYDWSDGQETEVADLGAGSYELIITDYCGFSASDSVEITQLAPSPMEFNLPAEVTLCLEDSVTLDATPTGGFSPFIYDWSNGSSSDSLELVHGDGGFYQVTVTDSCGFVGMNDITVYEVPEQGLLLESGNNNLQFGDPDTIVEGCSDGYIWVINPNDAPLYGEITITYGGDAVNGTDYDELETTFSINTTIDGDSLILPVNSILDNLDEGVEALEISVTFVMDACEYTLELNDVLNISDREPVSVTANDVFICPGTSQNSSANVTGGYSPYSYSWTSGGSLSVESFNYGEAGTYTVAIVDACNQEAQTTMSVADATIFQSVEPEPFYCIGTGTGPLFSNGVAPVTYSFDETEVTLTGPGSFTGLIPSDGGEFIITAIDSCGQVESVPTIWVSCDTTFPNIITPDGVFGSGTDDGQLPNCPEADASADNDYFIVCGLNGFRANGQQNALFIYNRWGNLVYENPNYDNSWDGTGQNGEYVSDGTYWYVFERSDGEKFSGDFQVITGQ